MIFFSSHSDIPVQQKENTVVQYTAYLRLSGNERQIHACIGGSLKFLPPARIPKNTKKNEQCKILHDMYLIRTII